MTIHPITRLILGLLSFPFRYWKLTLTVGIVGFLAWIYFQRLPASDDNTGVSIGFSPDIELTPARIRSIRQISRWEFLAIHTEELVDTVRKGWISDDRLTRIYTGTLRLGIDMEQAPDDWVHAHGDTVEVTLPTVRLLNKQFINEAATRAFYESGTWSGKEKEDMYQRAYRRMLAGALTRENLQRAESNGREQFASLFRSLGFRTVHINFVHPAKR